SAGLGACFLMPMIFALYWPRMTAGAAVGGMGGGGITVLALYLTGFSATGKFEEYLLLGLHPFIWSVVVSTVLIVSLSLAGKPPAVSVRDKFFGHRNEPTT